MGHQTVVVHTWVALVDRHGIAPVSLLDRPQLFRGQGKGLVPADGLPTLPYPFVGLA